MEYRLRVPGRVLCLVWLMVTIAPSLQAQILPRQHHPWGRFCPGSWKRVRVVTETYDERGQILSVSTQETKTTLVNVLDSELTLKVEMTLDVGGKRFEVEPQEIRQALTRSGDEQPVLEGQGKLELAGQQIPVEIYESSVKTSAGRRVERLYYSDQFSPYILRHACKTLDVAEQTQVETVSEVVAVDMPCQVLDELKTAAYVRTVHRAGTTISVTMEVQCAAVPGGVVAHSAREQSERGQLVRRSTLELVDYCAYQQDPRTGKRIVLPPRRPLFPRLRGRR